MCSCVSARLFVNGVVPNEPSHIGNGNPCGVWQDRFGRWSTCFRLADQRQCDCSPRHRCLLPVCGYDARLPLFSSIPLLPLNGRCFLILSGSAASALLPRETTDQQLVECVADLVLDSDGPFPVDAVKVEGRYTDSPPSPEVSPTVVGAAVVVSQRNAQGEDDSDSLLGAQRVAEPERL